MFADLPPSSSVTRLIVCGGAGGDRAADLGRSGESDLRDVGMLDEAPARRCCRDPTTTLTTPSGSPASSASSPKRIALSGVSSAGFSTTVLPAASAGAELPGGDRQREVPGNDQPDDAERLADREGLAPGDRDRLAEQPLGRRRVVAERLDRHPDLAARVADRLAGVARLEQRELLVVLLEHDDERAQTLGPRGRSQRTPGREGRPRAGDGLVDLRRARAGNRRRAPPRWRARSLESASGTRRRDRRVCLDTSDRRSCGSAP